MEIEEIRKKRFEFLKKVYDLSKANIHSPVSMWELGTSIGLEREEVEKIVNYLVGEYLIKHFSMGGMISITQGGIKKIEDSLSPKEEIKSPMQVTNIIVKKNINSPIQSGTNNVQQISQEKLDEYKKDGYIAGIVSILACVIFAIMVFKFGWDLTGQILTAISALFGILGIGSIIKPISIGQITYKILENISKNQERD